MSQDINLARLLGLDVWLTASEKDRLLEEVDKQSAKQRQQRTQPCYAAAVPEALTPNFLAALAACVVAQAWRYSALELQDKPFVACGITIASIYYWEATCQLAPAVATRTLQDTGLTRLWCFASNAVALIFIALMLCALLGVGEALQMQSHAVQVAQLLQLCSTSTPTSNCTRLSVIVGVVACCAAWTNLRGVPVSTSIESTVPFAAATMYLGAAMFSSGLASSGGGPVAWHAKAGAPLIVLLRGLTLLLRCPGTQLQVIEQGLLTAVLIFDLEVARLAKRNLHPWVAIMVCIHVVPQHSLTTWCMVLFYYISFFVDMSFYLNLPILTPCKNVYCDGVYDLCHVGHKNLFRNAAHLGHRLFVGVCSDKDCANYKRPPVMNQDERAAEIVACKSVYKVIDNAPCFGLTEEFIRLHRIHIVAFGEEYQERYPNPADDPYYKVPRQMGIGVTMPRTRTISTSDIITRVQKATAEKASPT